MTFWLGFLIGGTVIPAVLIVALGVYGLLVVRGE